MRLLIYFATVWLIAVCNSITGCAQDTAGDTAIGILMPRPGQAPRINGGKVFGVRPGHPLLFTIPATGERPLHFSTHTLPKGIRLDPATGRLSSTLAQKGTYAFTVQVANRYGENQRRFTTPWKKAVVI